MTDEFRYTDCINSVFVDSLVWDLSLETGHSDVRD